MKTLPYIVYSAFSSKMQDCCLELSKNKALKMLDLQTKSVINLDNLNVQH